MNDSEGGVRDFVRVWPRSQTSERPVDLAFSLTYERFHGTGAELEPATFGFRRQKHSNLTIRLHPTIALPVSRPFNGTHLDPTWDRLDAGCGLSH